MNPICSATIITVVNSPYVLGKEALVEATARPEMSELGIEVFR